VRGYVPGMTNGHDPDQIDPSKQSGRPVMVTGALVGIILALLLMLVVYFLAR
jgi:cobalamin biosynthesis Mg chelatase CobN